MMCGGMSEIETNLDHLEAEGFVVIEGALAPDEIKNIRLGIEHARDQGWQEGYNEVGNMWFDTLLEHDPETFGSLVAHPSTRPYLDALMGKQCQLRSHRAHINPGPYLQEWHLDFYGYWQEKREADKRRHALHPFAVNTTFYLQDNGPGLGHLKFVKHGHKIEPPHLDSAENFTRVHYEFEDWCNTQEHVIIYPKAGDCVIFQSHIPHQGAKERDDMERSNVVCHYQATPMYENIWFVSQPRGFAGTFPLAMK